MTLNRSVIFLGDHYIECIQVKKIYQTHNMYVLKNVFMTYSTMLQDCIFMTTLKNLKKMCNEYYVYTLKLKKLRNIRNF